jgi:hypothetical protein
MMERKKAEQEKIIPRNKVMKITAIGVSTLAAVLVLARLGGILPMLQNKSPASAVTFCVVITVFVAGFMGWYFTRTDEHDLHANLWSMAWAWVAFTLITVN